MKKLLLLFVVMTSSAISKINAQLETAAVVSVYTQGAKISPEMAESILRIELTKTEKYNVFDKLDMMEILKTNEIDVSNCYGQSCLLQVGKAAKVDKMVSASIEQLTKKIVITVKIFDIYTEKYEKIAVEEFISLDEEIQIMMQITLNKALGIENDAEMLNNFVYYALPPEAPITYTKNNGPRMGVAVVTGDMSNVLQADIADGGWDIPFPVLTQLGYQLEGAYLSAGNFQALIEGMVLLTGVEQGMFNPSFTFINGFRSSKNGWEFGFGPTFRFSQKAWGYYDEANKWNAIKRRSGAYYTDDPGFLDTQNNGAFETVTDPGGSTYTQEVGVFDQNGEPFNIERRMDSRGPVTFSPAFVFALGKTFKSGYLNIPVNLFLSSSKSGQFIGLSMGFNIAKKE